MNWASGWRSAVQSAAQSVANLVGQDIVARSISLTQAAASIAVQLVDNARLKLGAGTTDYLYSNGTLIRSAGPLQVDAQTGTALIIAQGDTLGLSGNGDRGFSDDGTSMRVMGVLPLTPASDKAINLGSAARRWSTIYAGDDVIISAMVGTEPSGTGITVNASTTVKHVINKATFTFAAAQTGATTKDVTLWTLPAKSRVLRVIVDVTQTFAGGAITDCDVTVGNSAGGNQYLVSFDVDTATGTFGEVAAEIGAALLSATYADVGWAAPITVQARFTSVGANLSALTQGSMTAYIEYCTYP